MGPFPATMTRIPGGQPVRFISPLASITYTTYLQVVPDAVPPSAPGRVSIGRVRC
jgi:hypothetical protein